MKKFLLILMSIIVLAVLCCGALVGCAGNGDTNNDAGKQEENNPTTPVNPDKPSTPEMPNTPSTPDTEEEYIEWSPEEFFEVWFASDNKSYFMPTLGITAKLHSNISSNLQIQDDIFHRIDEFDGDTVNVYIGGGNLGEDKLTWDATIYTKDMMEESSDIEFDDIVGYFNAMMKYQEDWQQWWDYDKESFNTRFKRNSQGWYEQVGVSVGLEIRFTKTSFMIKSPGYPEFEYAEVFTIGSDEITIPNEAKDALQLEIKKAKSPSEFLERWLAAENKTFYLKDGDGCVSLYDNMLMLTDKNNNDPFAIKIYEYVGGKINCYETNDKSGWTAKTYTIEEIETEWDFTFDGMQSLMMRFDYGVYDEYCKITEEICQQYFVRDWTWYVGNGEYEKQKFQITGKDLTIKFDYGYLTNNFDKKYVMGAEKIIIPDEAKEALKNA